MGKKYLKRVFGGGEVRSNNEAKTEEHYYYLVFPTTLNTNILGKQQMLVEFNQTS